MHKVIQLTSDALYSSRIKFKTFILEKKYYWRGKSCLSQSFILYLFSVPKWTCSAVDVSWCVLFPYSGDASGDGGPFPPSPIPILKLSEYREGLSWELFPRCSIHRFLKTHLHPSPGFSYFCKFTEPVFWGKRGRPQVGSALIHSMSVTKTGPLLFA